MIESDYDCIEHNSTIKALAQSIKYGLIQIRRSFRSFSLSFFMIISSSYIEFDIQFLYRWRFFRMSFFLGCIENSRLKSNCAFAGNKNGFVFQAIRPVEMDINIYLVVVWF